MATSFVRLGKEDDWKIWKELRLRALQDSPNSFGEKYEDAAKKTDDEWKNSMKEVVLSDAKETLFAIAEDQIVGLLYVFIRPDQHGTGGIGGLWVDPKFRQQNIGKDLVLTALDWLNKKHIKRVTFWNNINNSLSSNFYEKLGFVYSGAEKPLASDPRFTIGEMVKNLNALN